MYSYLKGIVTEIESNYITLDVNGIGYLIYTANPYQFNLNEEYKVYTYQLVKEDELSLYGFKTIEDKQLFLKLISVKGLGCKMALPMLATGSAEGIIDAIERENILYLKGKLAASINTSELVSTMDELVEVLKGLGYKMPDIKKVLPHIDRSKTIEEQIKEALRLLLK